MPAARSKSVRSSFGFLIAAMAGALISTSAKAHSHHIGAKPAAGSIADAISAAGKSVGQGNVEGAIALLQPAVQHIDRLAPDNRYRLLKAYYDTLNLVDDERAAPIGLRLVEISTKFFGNNDYRTASVRFLQSAATIKRVGNSPEATHLAYTDLRRMQTCAKTPAEMSDAAAVGMNFVQNLVLVGDLPNAHVLFDTSDKLLNDAQVATNVDLARGFADASSMLAYWHEADKSFRYGNYALDIFEKAGYSNSGYIPGLIETLAHDLTVAGKPADAERLLERASMVLAHLRPQDQHESLRITDLLAQVYEEGGKPDLAEPLFRRIATLVDALPASSSDAEAFLGHISEFYLGIHRFDEAREVNLREIKRAELKPGSPYVPRAYLRAATIELEAGKLEAAAAWAQKGRQATLAIDPKGAMSNAVPLSVLARIAAKKGDAALATDYWAKALGHVAQLGYPNRNHEVVAIHFASSAVAAARAPDWAVAREAGDSLTLRIVGNARLDTSDRQFTNYERDLFNDLLDIGWAARQTPSQ